MTLDSRSLPGALDRQTDQAPERPRPGLREHPNLNRPIGQIPHPRSTARPARPTPRGERAS